MDYKRITLFAGHYGSGKTNIAVNFAIKLKSVFENVKIADIDIVNPYFRTKDSEEILNENGIKLISSDYANTNVDVPALPSEIYSVTEDKEVAAVVDIGGDDRGALALGRYSPSIKEENNYNMLLVINMYRPQTRCAQDVLEIMREIEDAGKLKFTGIVNNSNLGPETTEEDVLSSLKYAEDVSNLTGLPIYMTTVKNDLFDCLSEKIDNLFPINIYVNWEDRI